MYNGKLCHQQHYTKMHKWSVGTAPGTSDVGSMDEYVTKTPGHLTRAVESKSEGILGGAGVGVGKNVPTPTPTSI
jgi:hypothetical protein